MQTRSHRVLLSFVAISFSLLPLSCRSALKKSADDNSRLDANGSEATMPMGDFDRLVETRFSLVCGLLTYSEDKSCKSDVITAACSQGKDKLSLAVQALMNDPIISELQKNPETSSKLDLSIRQDFYDAINGQNQNQATLNFTKAADRCLNHQKYKDAEEYEKLSKTPEFKSRAQAARRQFWLTLAAGAISDIVKQAIHEGVTYLTGKIASPNSTLTISHLFWSKMCSGGLQTVAAFSEDLQGVGGTSYGCQKLSNSSLNRAWSMQCLNTYAAICSASSGMIDLRNFGITTNTEIGQFVLETTNLGLSTLCNAGGHTARASCGVLNHAANQIGQTLRTGDNDLSLCTGSSLVGGCLGELWARKGWSNDNGINIVRVETGADGQAWRIRDCCHCRKDFMRSKSYAPDTRYAFENWLGVVQSGNYAGSNCDAMNDKQGTTSGSNYYLYKDCRKITVVGASCSLESTDDNSKMQDSPKLIWDVHSKSAKTVLTKKIRLD